MPVASATKRKIERMVTTVKCDTRCIQETKWDENITNQLKRQWKGLVFHANGTLLSRGVAIL